jgi:hypothetical protein
MHRLHQSKEVRDVLGIIPYPVQTTGRDKVIYCKHVADFCRDTAVRGITHTADRLDEDEKNTFVEDIDYMRASEKK